MSKGVVDAASAAQRFEEGVWPVELDAIETLRRRRRGEPEPAPSTVAKTDPKAATTTGSTGSAEPAGSADPDSVRRRAHDANLVGLAISGGGIRSATLALGVIQGLAGRKLLKRFDYLSTVSGGGYIGSWLLAWIQRRGIGAVEKRLPVEILPHESEDEWPSDEPEESPVTFLRRFSNYLTPEVGAFSADTWTLVATYVRNLFLNLTVLVAALAAVLLLPRAAVILSNVFRHAPAAALVLGSVVLAFGVIFLGLNVFTPGGRRETSRFASQGGVQWTVVLPLLVAAWLGGTWLWFYKGVPQDPGDPGLLGWRNLFPSPQQSVLYEPLAWAVAGALLYGVLWSLPFALRALFRRGERNQSLDRMWGALVFSAPLAGAVGALLLWGLTQIFATAQGSFNDLTDRPWPLIHVTVWGAPLILAVFLVTGFVQIGFMGRSFPEGNRQWWSRLGAWMMIYALTWAGIFAMAVYGPMVLIGLGAVIGGGLGLGWVGSTLAGLVAGRRAARAEEAPSKIRNLIAALAPQVFIIGLLALLALGLHTVLDRWVNAEALSSECRGENSFWCPQPDAEGELHPAGILECHSERMWQSIDRDDDTSWVTLVLLVGLFFGAVLLSWRVDINQFSMSLFYRSRLVRAYLGASRERRPQPFTGFDPKDDIPMAWLSPEGTKYDGPFSVINTTLNLVKGEELAWQERKGTSFVVTPLHSGFDASAEEDDKRPALRPAGFRPTVGFQDEGGISLGTAFSISGAAASPNMGAGTSPALAFLMTVFNVRLGWWLGNPRHDDTWQKLGPGVSLASLFGELFGRTDSRSRFVYLSDGGHFENLALYELVKRRCRMIVVSDGGADPDRQFTDLGNAIRKCRTDFGIDITMDFSGLEIDKGSRLSKEHYAVGMIHYGRVDPGAPKGVILYLKSSLTGDEPADIANYAARHEAFPHDPTSDQFFDESQFESYRKLGEHIAEDAFAKGGLRLLDEMVPWAGPGGRDAP